MKYVAFKCWAVLHNYKTNFIQTSYCVCYTLSLKYILHMFISNVGVFVCTWRSETFSFCLSSRSYFHIFFFNWLKVYLIKLQQPYYRTLWCVRCVAVLVLTTSSNSFTTVWKSVAIKKHRKKQTVDEGTNTTW